MNRGGGEKIYAVFGTYWYKVSYIVYLNSYLIECPLLLFAKSGNPIHMDSVPHMYLCDLIGLCTWKLDEQYFIS